jgi:dTDP-4-amino-4,6-dideoxygalactose transaminase
VAVPLQDLAAHHEPLRAELAAAAARVLASGRFINGEEVAAFEREAARALGLAHAIGVSSGTDGLLAALMASGVGPGDEVVTTPFSFFASVGAILRLGATPVFADIDAETLNLDADAAVARMGPRTKAVLVVHLFGRVARTRPLEAAADAARIPLIEDAAQSIGARQGDAASRVVGSLGTAAVLSFFPSKNLGGFGDGGMVLTRDADLAQRLRLLRVHGASAKNRHVVVGGNFRLDELQAALLRVKLPHLAHWTARRQALAARYRQGLASLSLESLSLSLPPDDAGSVWNQFVVRVPDGRRDSLRSYLADQEIASAIYYPTPLHLQPCVQRLGLRPGDLPRAERAAQEVLALPIYPELPLDDVDRVCEVIRAFFRSTSASAGAVAPPLRR